MSGFVSFVSSGPGDPELLTVKAVGRLKTAEVAYNRARDDHKYYVEIERPLQEESTKRSLQSSERYLESATEELNQLLKMYKEDDLTEETEEIILKRQRYAVESAEFRLKSSKLSTVVLPAGTNHR